MISKRKEWFMELAKLDPVAAREQLAALIAKEDQMPIVRSGLHEISKAVACDLQPLAIKLATLIETPDGEFAGALAWFVKREQPAFAAGLLGGHLHGAAAFYKVLSGALVDGFEAGGQAA